MSFIKYTEQAMRDVDRGKRMIEEMVLEQLLNSWPIITGKIVTDEGTDGFPQVEGSPDFVIGVNGKPVGAELAEIRDVSDAWGYFEEASRLAWQKHESYARRHLLGNPIILFLHSQNPALFDIKAELERFNASEFDQTGFSEVWAIDFSDAYYSPGHPLRRADMFCFKSQDWFGFHRIGSNDPKPYG